MQIVTQKSIRDMLAELASEPTCPMTEKRETRQGYMSFVIAVSNLIKNQSDLELPESAKWQSFTTGELEVSNTRDNIKLGGVSRP